MKKNNEGPRFTGGDHFGGLLKLYHETMMKNELNGGYGGYKISWAGEKSGFSFGGNQMDMSKNIQKADVFASILREARNEKGTLFFTSDEVKTIVGEDNEKLVKSGQSLDSVFGSNLSRINAALSSEYGQSRINEEYLKEMSQKSQFIETVINLLQNPAAKAFYDTVPGRVFLFDYNNQFNIALKGQFIANYIDGTFNNKQRVAFGTEEKITAPIDHYTIKDHKAFLDSTQECYEKNQKCVRRLDNIGKVFNEHRDLVFSVGKELAPTLPQPAEKIFPDDFSFFRKNGKWEIAFDLKLPPFTIPDSELLTPREMLRQATAGELYEYLPSGTFIQRDTFYYDGASKHLFYISPKVGHGAAAPFPHSQGEWYTVKQILIRKVLGANEHYYGEILPRQPNLANYDSYSVSMKKNAIEKQDLLFSMESEIGNPDTLALLSAFHVPIPDLIEKTKERETSLDEQLEDFFAFLHNLPELPHLQEGIALSERDIFTEMPMLQTNIEVSMPVADYQPSIWERLSSYFSVSTPSAEG